MNTPLTTDLVSRLRASAQCDVGECSPHSEIELEAATAIERLQWSLAEVKKEVCAVKPDWSRAMRIMDEAGVTS